eukprot:2516600-Alexandrium_andersonii.AAC.1
MGLTGDNSALHPAPANVAMRGLSACLLTACSWIKKAWVGSDSRVKDCVMSEMWGLRAVTLTLTKRKTTGSRMPAPGAHPEPEL